MDRGAINNRISMKTIPEKTAQAIKTETYYDKTDQRGDIQGRLRRIRELLEEAEEQPAQYATTPAPKQDRLDMMFRNSGE